jgi:hypothetical protein
VSRGQPILRGGEEWQRLFGHAFSAPWVRRRSLGPGASKSAFTVMFADRCAVLVCGTSLSHEEAGGRIEPKVPMPNGARGCSAKHV